MILTAGDEVYAAVLDESQSRGMKVTRLDVAVASGSFIAMIDRIMRGGECAAEVAGHAEDGSPDGLAFADWTGEKEMLN